MNSESSNSQINDFGTAKNTENNKKLAVDEAKIKKHSSFIIKNRSLHKNISASNSKQKLSKHSLNEKNSEVEPRFAPNKSAFKNHYEAPQKSQTKQNFTKQNSKSFQVTATKTRINGNPFIKREKYSLVENTPKMVQDLEKR